LLDHEAHSITGRHIHSTDAVLLAGADAVGNAVVKLMQQSAPEPMADQPLDRLGSARSRTTVPMAGRTGKPWLFVARRW